MLIEPIKNVRLDLSTSYYPFSADNANCILISEFVEPTGKEIWTDKNYQSWLKTAYAGNFQALLDDFATFDAPLRIYMDHRSASEFLYDYFSTLLPHAEAHGFLVDGLYRLTCQRAAVDLTHLVSPAVSEIQPQIDGWTHMEQDMSQYVPNVGAVSTLAASRLPFEFLLSDFMLHTECSPYYPHFVEAFKDLIRLRFFHDMRRIKDYLIYRTDKEDCDDDIRDNLELRTVEDLGADANDIELFFKKKSMEDLFRLVDRACWIDYDRYSIKFRMRAMVEAYQTYNFEPILMDDDFWMELSTVVPLRLKLNFRLIHQILNGRMMLDMPDPVEPIGTPILVYKKRQINVTEGVKRDISNSMMGDGRLRYPYAKPGA